MKFKIFALLFFVWFFFIRDESVSYGPGVSIVTEPIQSKTNLIQPFDFKGYDITPLASFDIEAKILSKENYRFDKESKLSPVDLALGWGRMSDEHVIEQIEISQSGRWYHWQTRHFPIPRREIETHSANMHMIPANSEVESALSRVHKGELVHIKGYLIRAENAQGYIWESSLTRNDTGSHACEVIFVNSIEKL